MNSSLQKKELFNFEKSNYIKQTALRALLDAKNHHFQKFRPWIHMKIEWLSLFGAKSKTNTTNHFVNGPSSQRPCPTHESQVTTQLKSYLTFTYKSHIMRPNFIHRWLIKEVQKFTIHGRSGIYQRNFIIKLQTWPITYLVKPKLVWSGSAPLPWLSITMWKIHYTYFQNTTSITSFTSKLLTPSSLWNS